MGMFSLGAQKHGTEITAGILAPEAQPSVVEVSGSGCLGLHFLLVCWLKAASLRYCLVEWCLELRFVMMTWCSGIPNGGLSWWPSA